MLSAGTERATKRAKTGRWWQERRAGEQQRGRERKSRWAFAAMQPNVAHCCRRFFYFLYTGTLSQADSICQRCNQVCACKRHFLGFVSGLFTFACADWDSYIAEPILAHVLVSTDAGMRVAEGAGLPPRLALIVHYDLPTRKVNSLDQDSLSLLPKKKSSLLAPHELTEATAEPIKTICLV